MPTATATSPTKAKARKPAAKKSPRAKAARSKATQAKATRTRATNEANAAVRDAQAATREGAEALGEYAERAVLIPVGAALIARERVVSGVSDTLSTYSSTTKTQAQLRRFERRGATARNRLEREVRKARVRFERELRQRRRELEKSVNDLEARRDSVAKNGSEIANRVQERILSLV
jgi:hypothetical protein